MGKILGIKGHSTRGKEVIELLQMMGGEAIAAKGYNETAIYVIPDNGIIDIRLTYEKRIDNYAIFTLEEFLKKFQYKVGDKVIDSKTGKIAEVYKINWSENNSRVYYDIKYLNNHGCQRRVMDLQSYKEEAKMSKKLAIVGHATRGREVIRLLKMLGGNEGLSDTGLRLGGTEVCCVYHIGTGGSIIYSHHSVVNDDFIVFTLEEFQKKYPFEVGDKVVYTKFGDNCDDYPVTIESMKWTGTTIEYTFNDCVTCLTKDLKMWEEKPKVVISGICLNSCDYADEVELNLGDYEIEVRGKRTYAVKKKPAYPTTYEECAEIMDVDLWNTLWGESATEYEEQTEDLVNAFIKLKVCRDAYWKIAGEQMGLGKPWEPNWTTFEGMPAIFTFRYNIVCDSVKNQHCLLVFPTEEMRNAFCKNFKDLIKQCKELL